MEQNIIKKKIINFFCEPARNVLSSQTLYEALMANLCLYRISRNEETALRAKRLSELILKTQLEDGGFDIGYNFMFGNGIKKTRKPEATTPEILSVYALIDYYSLFPDKAVYLGIKKGINWIDNHAYQNNDGQWVISYAPYTLKNVQITNAISFVIGTLAYYMKIFKDVSHKDMYESMCNYMLFQLTQSNDFGYWTYFEKSLVGECELYGKIDNYHIAQQLHYHIKANEYCKCQTNEKIIQLVSRYLKKKWQDNIAVKYIENYDKGDSDLHLWGYCALLICSVEIGDKEISRKIHDFIMSKARLENHFAPIIDTEGDIIDNRFYPRSDAWVLHALAFWMEQSKSMQDYRIVDEELKLLEKINYRGLENHALTKRKEILKTVIKILKR